MTKRIQIFKPGKHTASNGITLDFTESALKDCANNYDPAIHEAPLVVGHPKTDAPAYGWVAGLSFSDAAGLEVEPKDVDPEFAEMVANRRFGKVSASFYLPNSPANPKPGAYYLRHVGFLGAEPPAVKGLRAPEFKEGDEGVIEFRDIAFSGWDIRTIAMLFRRIREWIISKNGMEEADKVIQDYEINSLEINATHEIAEHQTNLTSSYNEGDEMSPEDKAKMAALEAENAKLKEANAKHEADRVTFAEAQAKQRAEAAHAANVAFAEGLEKEGKLLPVNKASTIALLDKLSADESKLEFGEGAGKQSQSPLEAYKAQLSAMPKLVEFGEVGGDKGGVAAGEVSFNAPAGYTVDSEKLDLHQKALAYAEANKVTYEVALTKVY